MYVYQNEELSATLWCVNVYILHTTTLIQLVKHMCSSSAQQLFTQFSTECVLKLGFAARFIICFVGQQVSQAKSKELLRG